MAPMAHNGALMMPDGADAPPDGRSVGSCVFNKTGLRGTLRKSIRPVSVARFHKSLGQSACWFFKADYLCTDRPNMRVSMTLPQPSGRLGIRVATRVAGTLHRGSWVDRPDFGEKIR